MKRSELVGLVKEVMHELQEANVTNVGGASFTPGDGAQYATPKAFGKGNRAVKTLTKRFLKDLKTYKTSQSSNEKEKTQIVLNSIYSLIDKGSKKNVYHKNTASRKKAKLAALLKTA